MDMFDNLFTFDSFRQFSDLDDTEAMKLALYAQALADFAQGLVLARAQGHEYISTQEGADASGLRAHLAQMKGEVNE